MKKVMLLIVGVVIPSGLIYAVWVGFGALFEPNVNPELSPYELYVEDSTTTAMVYDQLVTDHVLLTPEGLPLLANRKGLEWPRPGHYVITEDMSSNSIVNMLKAGLQTPVKVNFNSAATLEEIAQKLSEQLMIDASALLDALKAPMTGWEGPLALGAYLPDTYEMYWNASASSVTEKLYQNTVAFWTPSRVKQAKSMGLTPGEVSTLASIVMKESSKADDRPNVAQLYLNRLDKGMKLQADPTVIFAMKRLDPSVEVRRVLRKDLKIEDPYNTYHVKGLPPGPICVPEKAALLAVLDAPAHDYLYMCANPDNPGYHAFSSNYAGHLVNQRKWVNYLNKRKIYR